MKYGLKTSWTQTRTQLGIETHAQKSNDFASWLIANGNQPGFNSRMNCWEAVLFSAFRAGLVSKLWLQTVHRKAAQAYEMHDRAGSQRTSPASAHYFRALSHVFNFFSSVPFDPRAGFIPQPGDILFWHCDKHVAISLGRTWADGVPEDRILSLWLHAGGRFAQLTVGEMPKWMMNDIRFVPCPF